MLDFDRFQYFTFDCYGTLIDWESGILAALRPVLAAHGVETTDDTILHLYADFEAQEEQQPYRSYRLVLQDVVRAFGDCLEFLPSREETMVLAESVKHWRPFPDTVAALKQLATRYKLAVLSNVDDDLFADTALQLPISFAAVVTAQQTRSYKPALHHFHLALARLGASQDQVLHVAQSMYHDLEPAKHLGLATVWVNRRKGKTGFGATLPGQAEPDLEVPDLQTLIGLALK